MSKQVFYLSAPMTGMPDNNAALFDSAQAHLRQRFPEAEVISPVQIGREDGEQIEGDGWQASDHEYEGYLRRDMRHIDRATDIVFLKGWSLSGGAGREGRRAIEQGKTLLVLTHSRSEGWMPLLWISHAWFLANSTTKRLSPDALLA